MRSWKVPFFIVLALLIVSNAFWVYAVIDQGVSYTYLSPSYDTVSKDRELLGRLVVAGSGDYSKADILHLLRQAQPDAFIVDENDIIKFEQIQFRFENDRLIEVN